MSALTLSTSDLHRKLIGRMLVAVVLLGGFFFISAGTLAYWEAWLYLIIFLVPITFFAIYLVRHNPALLERRMRLRETDPAQRAVIGVSVLVFVATYFLPGLDRRFGWSTVPAWLVIVADVGFLLGYYLFVRTLLENEYAARNVVVEPGQEVITTGPYAVIRHPLYLAAIVMYGISPLALGSFWALVPAALLPLILVVRILNEEKMLVRELPGYVEYRRQVRWRLLPGIW